MATISPSRGLVAGLLLLAPIVPCQDIWGTKSIHLVRGSFDPLAGEKPVPAFLAGGTDTNLWIVQSRDLPSDAFRAAIDASGGRRVGYLPDHAYVVRMPGASADALRKDALVRWVGAYHPAYRLEPSLVAKLEPGAKLPATRFNLVVADKHTDKPALGRRIREIGGAVVHEQPGSLLFEVQLDGAQLVRTARFDEVLWIDRWTPQEPDMDNARIQGGGNFVEAQGGYTGGGINGHVYEGIEAAHQDFTIQATNVQSDGSAQDHGHCTSGIVFGNGTSSPQARGMAPGARPFYTNYSTVTAGWSRWQVVQQLVTVHDVMFTTASWGDTQTTAYTSVSADTDDILFDHDIVWTNSQSNTGNQNSRPQAWAKNLMSIGAVQHRDNANRYDDSWDAGGASIGPAADGRIKPNLCAYYDAILCSDRTGAAGYTAGNTYSSFGGTSGATPIVAGHNALAMQMYTDFLFNNSPRVPGGTRFQNRAHNATHRALMYANARQYSFTAAATDNRREHQGWGFPDLEIMWRNRSRMLVVDETAILAQGQSASYVVTVQPGDPELKVAMCFSDPAPIPTAAFAAINDLTLRVTSPSGAIYWGNQGLMAGNYSTPGGTADTRDTVECVLISGPEVGAWTVDVLATLVAQDGHVETPQFDADFGLCVSFGTVAAAVTAIGPGCPGSTTLPPVCASINPNGGTLAAALRNSEYGYRLTAPTALTVTGFEIFSSSAIAGPVVVTARIYGASGSLPAATAFATTNLVIGPNAGFHAGTFIAPVTIPGGWFYIGVDHSAQTTYLSNLSTGDPGVAFYRSGLGFGWAQSTLVTRPSVRVLCTGTGAFAVPQLDVTGTPILGATVPHRLTRALANSSAFQFVGISDTNWLGGALPFSLAGLGAPACSLLVSTEVVLGFTTDATGTVTSNLVIPSASNLLGVRLHEQFLVLDAAANSLGATTSNAVRVLIGT
ncbi:MAG: S8 family serine peptidase [Planctomycetes bacterium]|nr:S8 family serine peptidase [Planctomycetota bacterium]